MLAQQEGRDPSESMSCSVPAGEIHKVILSKRPGTSTAGILVTCNSDAEKPIKDSR